MSEVSHARRLEEFHQGGSGEIDLQAAARMPPAYRATWHISRAIARVYFRFRAYHPDRVPPLGPVILAANHTSFLDPPLIGCALHRAVNFIARESLFKTPIFGWCIRQLKAVPIDREGGGVAGIRTTLELLRQGSAVLLFPEGTRSTDGRILPARSGIGLTVIKSKAVVVPVRLFGALQAYGRHIGIPRPCSIVMKFGNPLGFTELREEAAHSEKQHQKEIYRVITDQIMAAIDRLEPCRDVYSFPDRRR